MQSSINSPHDESYYLRYLGLLGVRREEPSIAALTQLVKAHMVKVPFENISKLYRLKTEDLRGIPPLGQ